MKKCLSSVLAALSSVCVFTLTAKAEWAKSYDWDDSKDQTWTSYDNGGKHYISTGGWEIEHTTANGNEITINYVKTIGTANLLNFDTIERDTGLRLVKIGAQKFKNKWSGFTTFDLVFPASLAEIESEAFHTCPFEGDLVFPGRITLRNAAFYYTKAKTVTIKTPGSVLDGAAFGCGTGWSGTSDITGVTSIGNGSFQRGGSGYPIFEVVISAAVTNIGSQAFFQQRGVTLTVRPPTVIADIPDVDGVVASKSFSDVGANLAQGFTLTIPYRGGCTVDSQAFNWMTKCGNFEFWGKAPVFANDAFNSITANYAARITGCVEMDPEGWTALATPCTDDEKLKANYPGDDVCLGTYTSGTGCKFWVCKGKSPYTASADAPVLDGVSVVRTSAGYRIAGSLIQGSATVSAYFGENAFPLTAGKVTAPAQFDVELTVGDEEGQIPSGQMFAVSVKADDGSSASDVWTYEKSVYTGQVTIQKIKAASEYGFASGTFRVSRGDGNTTGELEVSYAASGTAVADTNYEKLPGKVVIPDGASFADIEIVPMFDAEDTQGTTLILTLTDGDYFVSPTAGSAEMLIESADEIENDIYVDCAALQDGDGSELAPFRTIQEAFARAQKDFSIHLRGGDEREYVFSSAEDQIVIPAGKSGLTICNWGEDLATLRVSDTYAKDLGQGAVSTPPILNGADRVTFKGLSFSFAKNSLAQNNYPYQAFLESTGNATLIEGCAIVGVEGDRWSSGQNHGIWKLLGQNAVVRNCTIDSVNVGSTYDAYQIAPIFIGEFDFLIEGCTVLGVQRLVNNSVNNSRPNVTAVSNRFINCIARYEAASSGGNGSDGLFRGAYTGINTLTLAYNIFYNDSTMAGKSLTVCQGCRETYVLGFVAHHNTVIGFDNFLSKSNLNKETCPASIFDNLFVLNDGGLVCNERWAYYNNKAWQTNNVPTSFKSGSFIRNNYLPETAGFNGGTLTEYEGYDFTKNVAIVDNIRTPAPVFESLDPASPKFCLMKQTKNPMLVGKNIAWTNDGEYPDYIGAIEPVKEQGLIFIIR